MNKSMCVRWDNEKGCVSPSPIIHLCSGYAGPGRCKYDGDMKKWFREVIPLCRYSYQRIRDK
jgi:hypothetical protein